MATFGSSRTFPARQPQYRPFASGSSRVVVVDGSSRGRNVVQRAAVILLEAATKKLADLGGRLRGQVWSAEISCSRRFAVA
jgi:hypothetical protein